MSTIRGCIAVGTEKKWNGVYNHADSNPTNLGSKIWDKSKKNGISEVITQINDGYNPTIDEAEKEEIKISNNKSDPLFIEWVYIINPKSEKVAILTHVKEKGNHKEVGANGESYESPNYGYELVDTYDLNEAEPDWAKVEELGSKIHEEAYEKNEDEKEKIKA